MQQSCLECPKCHILPQKSFKKPKQPKKKFTPRMMFRKKRKLETNHLLIFHTTTKWSNEMQTVKSGSETDSETLLNRVRPTGFFWGLTDSDTWESHVFGSEISSSNISIASWYESTVRWRRRYSTLRAHAKALFPIIILYSKNSNKDKNRWEIER